MFSEEEIRNMYYDIKVDLQENYYNSRYDLERKFSKELNDLNLWLEEALSILRSPHYHDELIPKLDWKWLFLGRTIFEMLFK